MPRQLVFVDIIPNKNSNKSCILGLIIEMILVIYFFLLG